MDKLNASTGELWLPCVLVMAVMAAGLTGSSTTPNTSRPSGDTALVASVEQNIPARLWQDPLEATEAVRKAVRTGARKLEDAVGAGEISPMEQVIEAHTKKDGVKRPDGTIDYLTNFHRALFLFVALPSDAYPEAAEQRIRSRFAIVSALSTAGYRPENAQRLGLAMWKRPERTSQLTYPFEVFKLDTDRRPMESERLPGRFDEAVVFYVEENAIMPDQQLGWLKDVSRMLAANSPPERFAGRLDHLQARYLGPFTSDRMLALLRDTAAAARGEVIQPGAPPEVAPTPPEAMRVLVHAIRPRIEASILREIIHPTGARASKKELEAAPPEFQTFVEDLAQSPRNFSLSHYSSAAQGKPWIRVERAGFDDADLTAALVHELGLRVPGLLQPVWTQSTTPPPTAGRPRPRVVLIGEWDTIYGRALPRSFEMAFKKAGGDESQLLRFTYLRGLDGQVSGSADKPKGDAAKGGAEPADLLRQLLVSRAPGMAYGRTQVDYIDRLAAHLQAEQRAHLNEPIRAIGILGTDTFDKLLILRSLRKVFPSVQYFTTELDAALSSPDQYDATRNLLVASGFDLRMAVDQQRTILPFRDSGQASFYYGTLLATDFLTMNTTAHLVRRSVKRWSPAVYEIGRGGPTMLTTDAITAPLKKATGAAPLPTNSEGKPLRNSLEKRWGPPFPDPPQRNGLQWQDWFSPTLALVIVLLSTLTQYGRLAVKRVAISLWRILDAFLSILPNRAGLRGVLRFVRRLYQENETLVLIAGAVIFIGVALAIPWISGQPEQEPFSLTEGLSTWPATWLRALSLFLGGAYFWIVTTQFRQALTSAQRRLQRALPPKDYRQRDQFASWAAWQKFCARTSGAPMKIAIIVAWLIYMYLARQLFIHLDPPASVTRGLLSAAVEKRVLLAAVFSMNLLIVYSVAHNISCAFFVREVADWLRSPGAASEDQEPLHTVLMQVVGRVAGTMTRMIYYPFTLLFLLIAARQALFDNFDWPLALIIVFFLGFIALLASTMFVRRSADQARQQAIGWLESEVSAAKWQAARDPVAGADEESRRKLARAEWQLGQVNALGGAALTDGLFSNPLLRAVLIPIGGGGALQLMEMLGKAF